MTRRRMKIVGLVVALTIVAYILLPITSKPPARLHVENFSRIANGMSQTEVEELLGGPPGNYGRHARGGYMMTMEGYIAPTNAVERVWCDDAHRFEIYFDNQNRVAGRHQRAGYEQFAGESLLEGIWREARDLFR
jgi:hypothetical protein